MGSTPLICWASRAAYASVTIPVLRRRCLLVVGGDVAGRDVTDAGVRAHGVVLASGVAGVGEPGEVRPVVVWSVRRSS